MEQHKGRDTNLKAIAVTQAISPGDMIQGRFGAESIGVILILKGNAWKKENGRGGTDDLGFCR